MSDLFPNAWDTITRIGAMQPGVERDNATATFLTTYSHYARSVALRYVRDPHHPALNDLTQIVMEYMWQQVLNETINPGVAATITIRWEAWVAAGCRDRLRQHLEKTDNRSSGDRRRIIRLNLMAATFERDFGHPPTAQELLAYARPEGVRPNHDAAYTLTECQHVVNLEPDKISYTPDPEVDPFNDDCVLTPMESAPFVSAIITACAQVSDTCHQVAQSWLGEFVDGGQLRRVRTPGEVAAHTGLRLSQVYTQIARIRQVAVTIAETQLGITSDDV